MPKTELKIVLISAEIDPFSKSGGLADVSFSLAKALCLLGHEVIVITPFYKSLINPQKHNLKKIKSNVEIFLDEKKQENVNFWQGELSENLPIYFIENKKYFSKHQTLYGSKKENARFLLFDKAALNLLIFLEFKADVINCHDWHTGLIPYFLKTEFQDSAIFKKTISIFTIHNLAFQLGHDWWKISKKNHDDGLSALPPFLSPQTEQINFAKRAILHADALNTVSETYAQEITTQDYGQGLEKILNTRKDRLFGIVNGINHNDYNPKNDPGLYANFDYHSISAKEKNKTFIQKYYGLAVDKNIPLICMTSRISEQKGFKLIKETSDIISYINIQFIIMGNGDKTLIKYLKEIQKNNNKKFVCIPFDPKMETSLYAASDFILIPSRFEPCGLIQMKGMRYGCIPIARHIGGLVDTVIDYNPQKNTGNGFVFKLYDSRIMLMAITRAMELFKRQEEHKRLVEKNIQQSFSWVYPANKYIELFKKIIKNKKKNN